ncbi:MAG: OmpW/AlkL family protein [Porticoccaceae bacterium]
MTRGRKKKAGVVSSAANAIVAGVLLAGAVDATAYQAGEMIIRGGIASVQPDESSSALAVNGVKVPGTGAGVDGDEALGLTFTNMLTSNLGVGVLASSPFKHDVTAKGLGVAAGSIKHLPPTVTLQYFPLASDSAIQPYVGLGVNYTLFFQESVNSELEAAIGSPGDLSLDNSLGWAGELGVDIAIDEYWVVNGAVWYADIDTDANFKFANGTRVKADVAIDPWVYMLGVGYKF